jgi:hypothetical protein
MDERLEKLELNIMALQVEVDVLKDRISVLEKSNKKFLAAMEHVFKGNAAHLEATKALMDKVREIENGR